MDALWLSILYETHCTHFSRIYSEEARVQEMEAGTRTAFCQLLGSMSKEALFVVSPADHPSSPKDVGRSSVLLAILCLAGGR